jgi:hypothetical protein
MQRSGASGLESTTGLTGWRAASSLMPACRRQTGVTTRSASRLSRRRCRPEGAAPPPSLSPLRSTPPVSPQSVRRAPACRAARSVPQSRGLRAPPNRFPGRHHARAGGIARCRTGSRPRPARHARVGRHSAGLPRQSCLWVKRHERAEIACVDGHPPTRFGRQLGRRAAEHRDLVASCERLAQHVATEGPAGAQDEEAGHHNPPG